jgi:hypothetical protein
VNSLRRFYLQVIPSSELSEVWDQLKCEVVAEQNLLTVQETLNFWLVNHDVHVVRLNQPFHFHYCYSDVFKHFWFGRDCSRSRGLYGGTYSTCHTPLPACDKFRAESGSESCSITWSLSPR